MDDHYIFMDGCIVKGCKPLVDFTRTFGEYAALLEQLYREGGWGTRERFLPWLPFRRLSSFDSWVSDHVHIAQSTQNMGTGARRVNELLEKIQGHDDIHLFGTSAAGSAMLQYFLLTDPDLLYSHPEDPKGEQRPSKRYKIDVRIASVTTIDAPSNWIRLRHDTGPQQAYYGKGSLGRYLVAHTRVKAGPSVPKDKHTIRMEDVPDTWVGAGPVAGMDYDNNPHFSYLPRPGMRRHMYTGSHMSKETREFLRRVWR